MNEENIQKDLGRILRDARERAGTTQEEFSRQTRISLATIRMLEGDDFSHLPPDVYLKGILRQYSRHFDLDEKELLYILESLPSGAVSGPKDRLPANRFQSSLVSKFGFPKVSWQPALFLLLAAFLYLLLQTRSFLLAPKIILEKPATDLTSSAASLLVVGQAPGAKKVFINGQEVGLSRNRSFSFDLALFEGLNSIEVRAENYLGKESKVTRYILYQPPISAEGNFLLPTPFSSPAPP